MKKRLLFIILIISLILSGCVFKDSSSLKNTLTTLISENLEGNDKEIDYITKRFEKMGLDKFDKEEILYKNVVGVIKGKENKKALVLSAHFDYLGWDGDNGAVDDSSGITVLLHVAEKLKEYSKENPFNMDILVTAFNGEELGLMGSEAFISEVKERYENIYNINIDCVGKKDGGDLIIEGDDNLNAELIKELSKHFTENNFSFKIGEKRLSSNHETFIKNNICTVNIGQDDVFTKDDTMKNIDYEYLENISKSIYEFILGNDGKVFKSLIDEKVFNTIDVWNQLQDMADNSKLNYDEAKVVEVSGKICMISSTDSFKNTNDIKLYYPELNVPKSIINYTLEECYINDGDFSYGVYERYDSMISNKENNTKLSKADVGKIIKRDLSIDTISRINFKYIDDDKSINLSISRFTNNVFTDYIYNNQEIIVVNDKKYVLDKVFDAEIIYGFSTDLEIDEKKYIVEVFIDSGNYVELKENESENETETIMYPSNTKEEIIEIINKLDLESFVKNLGF